VLKEDGEREDLRGGNEMRRVHPTVIKIGETRVDPEAMTQVLQVLGVSQEYIDRFVSTRGTDGQALIEFAGRMCYDWETEVLTSVGWKGGLDLSGQELIATWNPGTKMVEYQHHKLWKYHYHGNMLAVDHLHVNLMVTPEHRMYVQPRDSMEYEIVEARHLGTARYRFLLAGPTISGETRTEFRILPTEYTQMVSNKYGRYGTQSRTIGGLSIPSRAYLKLAGYYLSEGHIYRQPGSGAGIGLTQSEGAVLDDMITSIREAKLPFGVYPDPRRPRVKRLHVGGGRALAAHFSRYGRGSRNKTIPREIMALDPVSLRILYDAMWMGDGTNHYGARLYNTTSEKLADDVQELLLRLGIASSIHSHPLNGRPYYFVRELPVRHSPTVFAMHRRWVPYDGPVWCVSTESGIILVRRNKKPVWCGNCYESYQPHLNPNVTKIRENPEDYFRNVLVKGDGSIHEHAQISWAFLNISRICSHEIVRHRVGTAISQESLRYVRPRELKFWIPDELSEDQKEAMGQAVDRAEKAYRDLEMTVPWDKLKMDAKKRLTSALRRILPDGIATNMIWTANHRTLRWVIEMRTDPAAEVEIRMVFDQVAQICKKDYPFLYQDFIRTELPDGTGSWHPTLRSKV
jgi:thymidylate synthase (FAD)